MNALPLLLVLFLSSCIGLPDRATIQAGRGSGDIDGPKCLDFEQEASWLAVGLEFPISWNREPRPTPVVLYVPTPVPLAAAPATVIAAPAATEPATPAPVSPSAPTQAAIVPAVKEDKPWWEDFHAVQALVIALGAALATKYGKPAFEQVRTYVKKPRGKAKAKPAVAQVPASSKPPG